VQKVERTTTKLQVVFDGSPKSTSGYSLNDLLYAGPFVQPKTCTNLLRFDFLKLRCAETLEYRKGNRMAHVDFIFRNPNVTECEATNRVPEVRIDLTEVTDVREIIVQLNDGELLASLSVSKNSEKWKNTLSTCNSKSL